MMLIILNGVSIDENDAYPFNIDKHQQFAAKQAICADGICIHISATALKREKKTYQFITSIAQRFHSFPLPEIYFTKYQLNIALGRKIILKKLKHMLKDYFEKKMPVFIFVSNKKLGKQMTDILTKQLPELNTCFVSSDITQRIDILTAVRKKQLDVLVTTTILERGVTFKNLQVIVLDADSSIFDAQTLIQIAGRVGRSIDYPYGDIHFFYQYRITNAMHKAKKYHQNANKGSVDFL